MGGEKQTGVLAFRVFFDGTDHGAFGLNQQITPTLDHFLRGSSVPIVADKGIFSSLKYIYTGLGLKVCSLGFTMPLV